jgi:hypothetical protein
MNRGLLETEFARRTFFWGCALMGAVAMYVLSIGPAAMLYNAVDNTVVRDGIRMIYAPVVWFINSSDVLQSASLWYVGLWVDFG